MGKYACLCAKNVTFKNLTISLLVKKQTRFFIVYVTMNQHRGSGSSMCPVEVCCLGEEKPNTSNHGTQGRSLHVLDPKSTSATNYLFHPQCPEGLSCLMNEEKCRFVGNTCQPQCALIHSCVFSMESIKQRRHDLFFRCWQTISLDQNQQRTEPRNKYHHDVFSLITLLCSSSAPLSKSIKKQSLRPTLWWKWALQFILSWSCKHCSSLNCLACGDLHWDKKQK